MASHWHLLLDESSLAAVLPSEYVHFARPIRDALALFLGGLHDEDQAAIIRAQSALAPTATISQRLGLLAQGCPVLHKLGQILARDQRLSADLREQLRELESLPPTVSMEAIQQTLGKELGSLDRLEVELLPPAIAEASVAVVIPFRQTTGDRQGVFKVLKPGIEERMEHELQLLEQVGEHLDARCDELQIPHLDYAESFQQVRTKLIDEVRLEHEQRHLQEARELYADDSQVLIPRLFEFCTSRVTAMERVSGTKVTDAAFCQTRRRRPVASLLARALIAKPIFSADNHALFHGDPHAGNLFLTDDGRLAILDWSLVGRLGERERAAVAQIILSGITLDTRRVVSTLQGLSDTSRLDVAALIRVVNRWLRRVRRGQIPGMSWLVGLLDDATQHARLRVSPDLMLFRKSLHSLEGVVADVGDTSEHIDDTLCVEFVRHFLQEWPRRWMRGPESREYSTRISNLDLTRTFLSAPATAMRFWTGHVGDVLEACRQCGPNRDYAC